MSYLPSHPEHVLQLCSPALFPSSVPQLCSPALFSAFPTVAPKHQRERLSCQLGIMVVSTQSYMGHNDTQGQFLDYSALPPSLEPHLLNYKYTSRSLPLWNLWFSPTQPPLVLYPSHHELLCYRLQRSSMANIYPVSPPHRILREYVS